MDYDKRYIALGIAVSVYRKKKNITQMQLAEKVDVSRTYISNIEAPNMITPISMETLFKIADALEIEPYLLLKDNDI